MHAAGGQAAARRAQAISLAVPARCLLFALALSAGLLQVHYVFNQSVFVPLHTAMHAFSLVVSWLVFAIGWNTRDPLRAGSITLLACGFLGVALIDFGHALSYAGMPDLVTPSSPEKSIDFSLVSRLLAALSLLTIAVMPRRPLPVPARRYQYLAAVLGIVALVYWAVLFHPEVLPRTFAPGTGLTAFKMSAEYVLVALHAAAALGFYLQLRTSQSSNAVYLLAASVVMALSQSLNAMYAHPYDIHNFLSHVYRVVSYVLIYRGIFLSEMREPYDMAERLQRELRNSATRLREMSARMQQDIEEERKRISQALHDEMGQNLTALRLDVDWITPHCAASRRSGGDRPYARKASKRAPRRCAGSSPTCARVCSTISASLRRSRDSRRSFDTHRVSRSPSSPKATSQCRGCRQDRPVPHAAGVPDQRGAPRAGKRVISSCSRPSTGSR